MITTEKQNNSNTVNHGAKVPSRAIELLQSDPGSFVRIARRAKVGKSMVSMVVHGTRRSERVRRAVIREAVRLAKLHGYRMAIEIEETCQE